MELASVKSKLIDFANESSIHGVKFIVDPRSQRWWRVLWSISFVLSLFGLVFYSHGVYSKFSSRPDFSVAHRQTWAWNVPFPAVTICTPIFASPRFVTDLELAAGGANFSDDQLKYFVANMHACNPLELHALSDDLVNLTKGDEIARLIRESVPEMSELFARCGLEDCTALLTDQGVCYASNLLNFSAIYSDHVSDDFGYDSPHSDVVWTPDRGYFHSIVDDRFKSTMRALKPVKYGTTSVLSKALADNVCMKRGKSFTFFLHAPNEIPTLFHDHYSLQFSTEKKVTLTAVSRRSDDALRLYAPSVRGCFFEGERRLRLFRSYTKKHCELECLANYTLVRCGCVKFSMPRDKVTPVCDEQSAACCEQAIEMWPGVFENSEEAFSAPCGCLSACNEVRYSIKFERESTSEHYDHMYKKIIERAEEEDYDESHVETLEEMMVGVKTILQIKFNDHVIDEYETYVAYKLQNLIADIGGLLGLFLGCSLLSMIEIFYYLYAIVRNRKSY